MCGNFDWLAISKMASGGHIVFLLHMDTLCIDTKCSDFQLLECTACMRTRKIPDHSEQNCTLLSFIEFTVRPLSRVIICIDDSSPLCYREKLDYSVVPLLAFYGAHN